MTNLASHTPTSADTASHRPASDLPVGGHDTALAASVEVKRHPIKTVAGNVILPDTRRPQTATVAIKSRSIELNTRYETVTVPLTTGQIATLQQTLKQVQNASVSLDLANTPATLKVMVPGHTGDSLKANTPIVDVKSEFKQTINTQSSQYCQYISAALKAALSNQASLQSPLASVQIKSLNAQHPQTVALTLRLPNIDANYRLHNMSVSSQHNANTHLSNGLLSHLGAWGSNVFDSKVVLHHKQLGAVEAMSTQHQLPIKSPSMQHVQLSILHQEHILSSPVNKVLQQSPQLLSQLLPNTVRVPIDSVAASIVTNNTVNPNNLLKIVTQHIHNAIHGNERNNQQQIIATFDHLHSSSPKLSLAMGSQEARVHSSSPAPPEVKALLTLGNYAVTRNVNNEHNGKNQSALNSSLLKNTSVINNGIAHNSASNLNLSALQKIVDTAVLRLQQPQNAQDSSRNNAQNNATQMFKQQLMTQLLTMPQFSNTISSSELPSNALNQLLSLLPQSLKISPSILTLINDAKSMNTHSIIHLVAREIAQQIHAELHQNQSSDAHLNEYNQHKIDKNLSEMAAEYLTHSLAAKSGAQLLPSSTSSTLLTGLVNFVQIALARRLQTSQNKQYNDIASTLISRLSRVSQTAPSPAQSTHKIIDEIASEAPKLISSYIKKQTINALKVPDVSTNINNAMYWTIPNQLSQQASDIEVLIGKIDDQNNNAKDDAPPDAQSGWQLLLRFDIENAGSMLSRVNYANNTLDINLYGDNPRLVKRIKQYLPYLHKPLSKAGIIINQSQVNLGKIPSSLAKIETCHVNFEV